MIPDPKLDGHGPQVWMDVYEANFILKTLADKIGWKGKI